MRIFSNLIYNRKTFISSEGVILYLVQRYVLDQSADHCSGGSLSHINLLHIQTVSVRVLLCCDYTADTQVQTRHIHLGILLAGGSLFLLSFLSCRNKK